MTRLKTLISIAALAAVLTTLIRNRLGESQPVDAGGWEPVEPSG